MPPKKCCCGGGGNCGDCQCELSDCFQVVDPPTLTSLCMDHPLALEAANAALTGVMQYREENEGQDSCVWWNHHCVELSEGVYAAYSLELRRTATCQMRLNYWSACGLSKEECCEDVGVRPPTKRSEGDSRWTRIVSYAVAGGDFVDHCSDEEPITLTKVSEAEDCEECDQPDACCDFAERWPSGTYHCTFESSCPALDGITFTLTGMPFTPGAFWQQDLGGSRCDDNCRFQVTFGCNPTNGKWIINFGFACYVDGVLDHLCYWDISPGNQDAESIECDPLAIVFEMPLDGGTCGTCTGCTVIATITN